MPDVRMDDPSIATSSVLRTNRVPLDKGDGLPHTATLAQILALGIGIWFGTQAEFDALDPGLKRTYAEWLATGVGYFEFHVFTDTTGDVAVTALTVNMGLVCNIPSIGIPGVVSVTALTASLNLIANAPSIVVTGSLYSFSDDFVRANNANIGASWTQTSSMFSILSNRLHWSQPAGSEQHAYLNTANLLNAEVLTRVYISAVVSTSPGFKANIMQRRSAINNYYCARIQADTGNHVLQLIKWISGTGSIVGTNVTLSPTPVDGDAWNVRYRLVGSNHKVRAWKQGTTEPSTWDIDQTDADISVAGRCGIAGLPNSFGDVELFQVNEL